MAHNHCRCKNSCLSKSIPHTRTLLTLHAEVVIPACELDLHGYLVQHHAYDGGAKA